MRRTLKILLSLLGLALASGALSQGMFDTRTLRPQGQAQPQQEQGAGSTSRGSVELLPETPGTPTISNRLRPGEPVPVSPEQMQQRLRPESRERIEFQDFILQSTGRDLPIFGANLFRQAPSTFAPVDNIPVTSDYVIGPGDEIQIRAWGQIDVDFSATVDRNGAISVPKVGAINVAGIRYQDLPDYLKAAFGRVFRNFQLTASLGRLRSIQIFVVGQAKSPGTYTVSSLSTLVTALFAAGGPSSAGSMRSIQLKRGNQVVTDLDLYDFIVSGDKSKDARLLPGDVIYIPPVGALVAVNGSVNAPAIYELKEHASIFDLLRWAGGLATTAQGQKVTLERIEDRKVRKVEEFALDYGGLRRGVRDGDLLTVYSLVPRFDDTVTLRGNVAQPGRFPWRDGMRVRDLIPNKEALLSREYLLKRNQIVGVDESVTRLLRQQESAGTQLGIGDLAERAARDESNLTIGEGIRRRQIEAQADKLAPRSRPGALEAGPAQAPQRQAETEAARLVNQIKTSPKEVNWDYAVIERIKPDDLSTTLLPFNLGKAVLENDPQQNLPLQAGDVVTVFSRGDLQVPASKQTKFIRLEGEFAASGVYEAQPGETLRHLVERVGGFAPNAYLFGALFTRETARAQQQQKLDETLDRLEREVQLRRITSAQSVLSPEDAQALQQQAAAQQALLARLRQLKATGRIVLQLSDEATLKDLPELALEDGDQFIVPPTPTMVSVFGAVFNQSSFVYQPEKRVSDYLSLAGGPTREADSGSAYLLRANGSVISRRNSGFIFSGFNSERILPGDAIVVPEDLDKTTFTKSLKDWTQIFFQFGLAAAAIHVLSQ
jgi:protein involved in polysaccharide export with SLBB domain